MKIEQNLIEKNVQISSEENRIFNHVHEKSMAYSKDHMNVPMAGKQCKIPEVNSKTTNHNILGPVHRVKEFKFIQRTMKNITRMQREQHYVNTFLLEKNGPMRYFNCHK